MRKAFFNIAVQAGLAAVFLAFARSEGLFLSMFTQQNFDGRLLESVPRVFVHYKIWVAAAGIFLAFINSSIFSLDKTEERFSLIFFSLLVYVVVLTRALQFPYCVDDAYIDFRHVLNIVNHGSLDYNVGEPVMGFTSHLHVAVLTLLSFVTGSRDIAFLSISFNHALSVVNITLVLLILRGILPDRRFALLGAMLYALSFYYIRESIVGKETLIVTTLLLVSIWAVHRKRTNLLAWSAALVFLTRPEGFLFVLAAVFWTFRREPDWKRRLIPWVGPAALVLLCYSALFIHFGTVLPHGMVAKKVTFKTTPLDAVYVMANFLLHQSFGFKAAQFYPNPFLLLLMFLLAKWAAGPYEAFRIHVYSIFPVALFFAAANPPIMQTFSWYLSWLALLAVLLIPVVLYKLMAAHGVPKTMKALALIFAATAPITTYPYGSYPFAPVKLPKPLFLWSAMQQRLLVYEDAAVYLNTERPDAKITAACEDGMFGYVYKGRVLALDGLASHEVLKYYPLPASMHSSVFSIAPKAIEELRPDFVVLFEEFARNGLLKDPHFLSHYEVQNFWPVELWGGKGLYLYGRKTEGDRA